MDLWNPLDQLETTFYCRQSYAAKAGRTPEPYCYHNHVLVGCNLWYLQRRLKPAEVGKYRLVLVQGTRVGRMRGISLSSESEVNGSVFTGNLEGVSNTTAKYLIEVTGTSHADGQRATWQLITLSEEIYHTWLERLKKARAMPDIMEASGEAEKLRTLAKRMREGLVVRQHVSRFRFYARTFLGSNAIAWIMKDKQCTASQATNIGNRLMNLGFIHHVTYEHLFCSTGNLLYRFSDEIAPTMSEKIASPKHSSPVLSTKDLLETSNRLLTSYQYAQHESVRLKTLLLTEALPLLSSTVASLDEHNSSLLSLAKFDHMVSLLAAGLAVGLCTLLFYIRWVGLLKQDGSSWWMWLSLCACSLVLTGWWVYAYSQAMHHHAMSASTATALQTLQELEDKLNSEDEPHGAEGEVYSDDELEDEGVGYPIQSILRTNEERDEEALLANLSAHLLRETRTSGGPSPTASRTPSRRNTGDPAALASAVMSLAAKVADDMRRDSSEAADPGALRLEDSPTSRRQTSTSAMSPGKPIAFLLFIPLFAPAPSNGTE